MYLRTSIACILALSVTNVFAQSTTIQHEASIGFSDIRDGDDNFFGVSYRYYLDGVKIDKQAWAISPYLQRVNNVTIDYFSIDDIYRAKVAGEWFLHKDWIVRGRYGRTEEDENYYNRTLQRVGFDFAKFISSNWEVGAGFDYYSDDQTIEYPNSSIPSQSRNENEFSLNVFARYTSFDKAAATFLPGWDVKLKASNFDNEYSLEVDTDYFFTRKWSVGVDVIHGGYDDFSDSNTIVELGTNYWFNPYSSISFGVGIDTDDNDLGSLTLLGTFRF